MASTLGKLGIIDDGIPAIESPFGRALTVFNYPVGTAVILTSPPDDDDEIGERELQYDWQFALAELNYRHPDHVIDEDPELLGLYLKRGMSV